MNEKVIVSLCIFLESGDLVNAIEELHSFTKKKYPLLISVEENMFKHEFHNLYSKKGEHILQLIFNTNERSRESIKSAYLGFLNDIEKEKFNYFKIVAADERFFHYYEY